MRKLCLGPAVPATCKACGKKVGVPHWSMLLPAPLIAVILVFPPLESFWLGALFVVSGFALGCAAHLYWVPLEKR